MICRSDTGEVESAHRYVIQDRLKIAGTWWKEENADYMSALRTLRINDNWDSYWKSELPKAASLSSHSFNYTPVSLRAIA